jgi:hypothetical protein
MNKLICNYCIINTFSSCLIWVYMSRYISLLSYDWYSSFPVKCVLEAVIFHSCSVLRSILRYFGFSGAHHTAVYSIWVTLNPTRLPHASERSVIYLYTSNFETNIMFRYQSNVIYKAPKVTYILCSVVSCGRHFICLQNHCKFIILLKCAASSWTAHR